jgi:hypothetical protein
MGDIIDAYVEGKPTQRVMIISKNEDDGLIFGLTKDHEIIDINPETEVEKIIMNVYEN